MRQTLSIGCSYLALLLGGASSKTFAQLTSDQGTAKTQGIEFYNQFKVISALPYLQLAAKAGDSEVQQWVFQQSSLPV